MDVLLWFRGTLTQYAIVGLDSRACFVAGLMLLLYIMLFCSENGSQVATALTLCDHPCLPLVMLGAQMIYLMQDAVSPQVREILKLNVKRCVRLKPGSNLV